MNHPETHPNPPRPPRPGAPARGHCEEDRAFLIAAIAVTHDLLVMNHRPDLAPEFAPARVAMRSRAK